MRKCGDRQRIPGYVLVAICLSVSVAGCVTPLVTQAPDPKIDFKKFKTVSFSIEDQVNTSYSKDTVNLFDGLLRGRLKSFGYEMVDHGSDFSIQIFIDEANQADKAAMFFIGFDAGRALLTFTALFKDSGKEVIARFTGGKSLHGGEIGGSALWKSHDEMQLEMIGESVRQIARFIETNGTMN